jgi:hypothetical protein
MFLYILLAQDYYYLENYYFNSIMNGIYDGITSKLDKMKEYIVKMKQYDNKNSNLEFLQKLDKLSSDINMVLASTEDMYDSYLETMNSDDLTHEDKNLQKDNQINKQVYNKFLPYMLYLQIILKNV